MIYSDDNNIRSFGARLGLTVIRVSELPLPPEDPQEALNLVVRTAADEDEAEEDS